jgi:hypothetical protein
LRQRVLFRAVYDLESDQSGFGASGSVNLAHGDVSITRTNLVVVSGVDIHHGAAAGASSFAISVRGEGASHAVTISDVALALSAISASVGETLVTSLTIGVSATFSGQGVSCTYTDGYVRGALGTTIQDVATFEVASAYSAILSVADTGALSALSTHWARAPVAVRNKCSPGTSPQEVSVYVNKFAAPGELDMGEASRAPLQAGGSLSVRLWFDLSATYSGACGSAPIETIAARLFYHSNELSAQSATNQWRPHGGSFQGTLQLVPQPVDAPASGPYDKWSQVVYAGIVQPSFNGRSWSLLQAATVVLGVQSGVSSGTIGFQVEVACGGNVHFLPSASTLHEMRFTTSWNTVQVPPARRMLRARIAPRRRLAGAVVHGDVTNDGVTNALDLTAVVNYFKAPGSINLGAMSANQKLWLDANRDGSYGNAGDVLYAARAFAGATVYPVFDALACPTSESADLVATVSCYSASQALLGAVEVAAEVAYTGSCVRWSRTPDHICVLLRCCSVRSDAAAALSIPAFAVRRRGACRPARRSRRPTRRRSTSRWRQRPSVGCCTPGHRAGGRLARRSRWRTWLARATRQTCVRSSCRARWRIKASSRTRRARA